MLYKKKMYRAVVQSVDHKLYSDQVWCETPEEAEKQALSIGCTPIGYYEVEVAFTKMPKIKATLHAPTTSRKAR